MPKFNVDLSKPVSLQYVLKLNCFRLFYYELGCPYLNCFDFTFDDFTFNDYFNNIAISVDGNDDASATSSNRSELLQFFSSCYDLTYTNLNKALRINHKRKHKIFLKLKKNALRYCSKRIAGV